MRKFLVVGVGGSGGATVRYLMDELRADLRAHGVEELPPAWQFVHIDVNPKPERTSGLGTIEDLGGRYVSVSSADNSFRLVRQTVQHRLERAGHLGGLAGWHLRPQAEADQVPVVNGAGQYRAVGRMLTLTRLTKIQATLQAAWEDLQQSSPWGELPFKMTEDHHGDYKGTGEVIPIVIGSMAGGSGASMFLDVCQLMGHVGALRRSKLGVFLFTPDVFHSLPKPVRQGIDGNALGALGELIAAQTGSSAEADNDLLEALGLPRISTGDPVFRRVFPIGATIGGFGAKFGETAEDVFRGLGRALAATMSSETAAHQYDRTHIENYQPPINDPELIGWGADPDAVTWASFGYATLSLGRDRYAQYAAQRLARVAVDRLTTGFRRNLGEGNPTEQLERAVRLQWPTIVARLGLRADGQKGSDWLRSGPLPTRTVSDATDGAVEPVRQAFLNLSASTAAGWMQMAQSALAPREQAAAVASLQRAAYAWAEEFAHQLEESITEEVLRLVANPHQGLPYARQVVKLLEADLVHLAEDLARAPRADEVPMQLRTGLDAKTGKLEINQVLKDRALDEVKEGVRKDYVKRAAHYGSAVLKSYVDEALPALARALADAHRDLEAAKQTSDSGAGLAQLHTTSYREWPGEEVVPSRFEHAFNEVLLTTSEEFPATFRAHVEAATDDGVYGNALDAMVEEITVGRWQDTGAGPKDFEVLQRRMSWRSSALPTDAQSPGKATPPSRPDYSLALSPKQILERAAGYQARQGHFSDFSNESLDGYLNDPRAAESERDERRQRLVTKFEEAVQQAYPLAGVDRIKIDKLSNAGNSFQVELAFGAVPLTEGSAAAKELLAFLEFNDDISAQSKTNFEKALSGSSRLNRITISSTYPPLSPLVYKSFLGQLQDRWSSLSDDGRDKLWRWKRTRPLPAAIGMSVREQRAMISGWYVGRALGLVHQPESAKSADPVQVFDIAKQAWRPFEVRQLSPRKSFDDAYVGFEWLPNILEGHALALVNHVSSDGFESLEPYRALRQVHQGILGTQGQAASLDSAELLENWIRDGVWPSGEPSGVAALRGPFPDPDARAAALRTWVDTVQRHLADGFLTAPRGPGVLAQRKVRVDSVAGLETFPGVAEIAGITHEVLDSLLVTIDKAHASVKLALAATQQAPVTRGGPGGTIPGV